MPEARREAQELRFRHRRGGQRKRAADAAQPLFSDRENGVQAKLLAGEANYRAGDDGAAARFLQDAMNAGLRGEGGEAGKDSAARAAFLLGELVRKEYVAWGPVVKAAGIKPE